MTLKGQQHPVKHRHFRIKVHVRERPDKTLISHLSDRHLVLIAPTIIVWRFGMFLESPVRIWKGQK